MPQDPLTVETSVVLTPHSDSAPFSMGAYASFPTCAERGWRARPVRAQRGAIRLCLNKSRSFPRTWPTKKVWYPSLAAAAAWLAPCAKESESSFHHQTQSSYPGQSTQHRPCTVAPVSPHLSSGINIESRGVHGFPWLWQSWHLGHQVGIDAACDQEWPHGAYRADKGALKGMACGK